MNRSLEMVAFSAWLETPAGRRTAWVAVSAVPFAAMILAVVDQPEAAMKTTAAGILLVTSFIAGSFRMCGRPLIRFIDESIENRKARGHAKDGDDEDRALLAARNKVTWTLSFAARQMTVMGSTLMFAIFSKYGTAAPLLLFDTPMVVITIIKLMVSVQLFAGRTKLSAPQGLCYRPGVKLWGSQSSQSCSIMKSIFRKGKVVPLEEATSLEQTAVD